MTTEPKPGLWGRTIERGKKATAGLLVAIGALSISACESDAGAKQNTPQTSTSVEQTQEAGQTVEALSTEEAFDTLQDLRTKPTPEQIEAASTLKVTLADFPTPEDAAKQFYAMFFTARMSGNEEALLKIMGNIYPDYSELPVEVRDAHLGWMETFEQRRVDYQKVYDNLSESDKKYMGEGLVQTCDTEIISVSTTPGDGDTAEANETYSVVLTLHYSDNANEYLAGVDNIDLTYKNKITVEKFVSENPDEPEYWRYISDSSAKVD